MDGTVLELGELSADQYETKCQQTDREGEIYRSFRKIIFEHSTAIEAAYPKVMRRVNGYPLDELHSHRSMESGKIFAGSEGSLGIILQAKVNLEPIPKYKAAFTVHYDDRMRAIREVYQMIAFDPAAIEMLDFNVFEQSVKNNMTKGLHQRLIVGTPQATLSVEFFCLSQEELDQRITEFSDWLKIIVLLTPTLFFVLLLNWMIPGHCAKTD
jgi:FAD/FMN-containing dehydrogenase